MTVLKQSFLKLLYQLARLLLSLRYKCEVKEWGNIKKQCDKKGGILFLPNHPAEIDPVLLMSLLGPVFAPHAMVVEHFYRIAGFQWLLDLAGVLPIPTMDDKANKWRGKQIAKVFDEVSKRLNQNENFIIYPSGRLKLTGHESLGGASFAHELLQKCPNSNVVLVRTTGLWGSSFSRALTGKSPNFGKTLLHGIKVVLKNGIFFVPRRKVTIEFEVMTDQLPINSSRIAFNKYLEEWYNRYPQAGSEPLTLCSYSFWKEDLPEVQLIPSTKGIIGIARVEVPSFTQKEVLIEVSRLSKVSVDKINAKDHLSTDLGLDSLDVAELYVFLDRKFDVVDLPIGVLQTVDDVLQAAAGAIKGNGDEVEREKQKAFIWKEERGRKDISAPEGNTIIEAFLRRCQSMGSMSAVADSRMGILSYRKLKVLAIALAQKLQKMPGDKMGIMMPSSVGTYLLILACMLAKKTPVMLNWTTGTKALDHAVNVASLQTVITSSLFLDRLDTFELGLIEDRFVFIEDLKKTLTVSDKINAFANSLLSPSMLMKKLSLDQVKQEDMAVLLFTSGTETLPKAVPLSHKNILSNLTAALSLVDFSKDDRVYGVLPPFHSFGFSVTGLFPILSGLRVYYAPDPSDSHGIACDIEQVKPTLFCCAPSFIRSLFAVAKPHQLTSLRYVVSGAEKTPQELFDYVNMKMQKAALIEGYGITECSPIVTMNRPWNHDKGVGKPLPGVELCVIDPITQKPLSSGQDGEICIKGPNVFSGYLHSSANPFITIENERWYLSGDRGSIDAEGNLLLSGRLKRFVKIGGEMVSLGGLEDDLLQMAKTLHWFSGLQEGPPLALCAKEKNGEKPELVLFTTFPITKEQVNTSIKESGWGRIIKIAEVRTLGAIPLTGTGKTHYRLLDETYFQGTL